MPPSRPDQDKQILTFDHSGHIAAHMTCKGQLASLFPIIDIPISSPSPKRTRKTRKKLPSGICLVSRATKPDCSSLWQHIAVENNQTMVVAGSVNFLMRRRRESKSGWVADEKFCVWIRARHVTRMVLAITPAA
jgi:hypothetical protein